jgi:hypothetical protein
MKNMDPRMIFGFCLLGIFAILALAIAFGRIEETTSFGLQPILGGLTGLGGAWGVWAFSKKDDEK